MELTICHLYPDAMSLYGEYANVELLRRRLESCGVQVSVRRITCEDAPDFTGADLIYMGAGTERSQKAALLGLLSHADQLMAAVESGGILLFTGNAMELLGTSVTDRSGKLWSGLHLAEFYTEETDRRIPGDVIAHSSLLEHPAVGFMNKCSVTHNVSFPLFTHLSMGFGNDAPKGAEGYCAGNLLATHLTGPVLVKNPELADLVLQRLFAAKGWTLPSPLPELPYAREAYAVTLKELSARLT